MSASPDETPTDGELLAAVAEGAPEAFGALYDRHASWLMVLGIPAGTVRPGRCGRGHGSARS